MPIQFLNTNGRGGFTLKNNSGAGRFSMSVSGTATDTDAQAFFDRVTAAGGSLSLTEQNAVNQLVLDLKANSLWNSMTAIYPMVGASAAACAQNLKSSSYTGSFSGGWTYTNTGVLPNGTNAYMDTGLNSSTVLSLNNLHFSVYLRTNTDGLKVDLGVYNNSLSTGINIFTRFSNILYLRLNDDDLSTISTTDSRGFKLGTRNNSTTKNIFNNNVKTSVTSNSISLVNLNVYLAAFNNTVGGINYYSDRQNAFASLGLGLSDTDSANFYTNVQTFQTSLSRQV